ncbi:MAG: right-handed parallel beta-helix repeat-containing protein [Planctomycetes bacterium]|nr:right-handed parallel beta-helix repeat-containing protein [Planctomycetota bacterium]
MPARPHRRLVLTFAALVGAVASPRREAPADGPAPRTVRTVAELRAAAAAARPGQRIRLAPGTYEGGIHLEGLRGAEGKPVVVEPEDPKRPPVVRGGGSGLQLSSASWVEVRGLVLEGARGNGLNVDDAGRGDGSAHHLVVADVVVRDVGPDGNCDGIKLSGLEDFRVERCVVERWGRGGSAVDMVGCRRGTIEGSTFRHEPGTQGSGVQMKGATRDVTVRRNRFEHAGSRAVNAGGSTGLAYFRPPLDTWKGDKWEAKDLRIEGNTFVGADTPVAFVGVDGAVFRFNTVWVPGRWAMRILQETVAPGFVPCRNVEVSDNVVAFRSDRWSEGGVNVGGNTAPDTFRFARNVWWCVDAPPRTRSLVRLPTPEQDGVHGKDPRFVDPEQGDLRLRPDSPVRRAGADALKD